jgi:hypothetical protein
MKREILYGTYYLTFKEFKTDCEKFFRELSSYQTKLRSMLTERDDSMEVPVHALQGVA